MDAFTHDQVQKIFKKMINKPMCGILKRYGESEGAVLSLNVIQENLDKRKYASAFDFALDMRELIILCQNKYEKDHMALLILSDLSDYFERKSGSLPRSEVEYIQKKLQKLLQKSTKIRRAMSMSAYSPEVQESPNKIATSKSLHGPPAPLVNEIQRMLDNVKDVSVLAEIARILKSNIPEFVIEENTIIDVKQLSPKCLEDIRAVLIASNKK